MLVALLGLLVLAAIPACGRGVDPVQAALSRLEDAAEKRDAEGISAELSEDFQAANGEARAELTAGLRRILAGYDSVSVRVSNVVTERGTGLAHVTFRAALSGKPRALGGMEAFLETAAAYRFDLRMVEREGRYRITKAAWERE